MPYVKTLDDFSGGYATDLTPERMDSNMLLTAENVYWREGIVNRTGKETWSTMTTDATACRGMERCYLNSAWISIEAVDNGSNVRFLACSSASPTTISTGELFQTAYDVSLAQLGDYVVAVNGYNRPKVIYYSTGSAAYAISDLDVYDIRTVSSWDYYGGYRYTTGTTQYVDYSSEAYNTSAGDFPLAATTYTSDGCYITADYPFSRIVFTSCQALTTATPSLSYLTASGWTTITTASGYVETTAYTTMFQSVGDKTLDLDYIPLWTSTHGSTVAVLANKYALRMTFPTYAPSTVAYCQKISVYDRHYLTRVLGDDRPSKVTVHNNRVWLAAGNNVNWSPYNKVTGWDVLNQEYFTEGGKEILAMVTHVDYLLIFKESALWGFLTASYDNLTKTKLSNVGTISGRSIAIVNQLCFFMANDGIRMWTGENNVLVSKHIKSDIDSWTRTNTCAAAYKGYYWLAFPTNGVILIADPDTYRTDDLGDGRLSWYKFTTPRVDQFNYHEGAGDNKYLLGITNTTNPLISRLDNGNPFDDTSTTFTKTIKTKYLSFSNIYNESGSTKIIKRFKPEVLGAGDYTFTMSVDHGGTVTTDIAVTLASTGSNVWSTFVSVPYQMDGTNIAVQISNATTNAIGIYSISADIDRRRY